MAYTLERYHGRQSRHKCPYCGAEFQFSYYVDESGTPLNEWVGRCNRENNCGKHYKPSDFFREHPDLQAPEEWLKPLIQEERKMCYISGKKVMEFRSDKSRLIDFLKQLFMDEDVERVCKDYYIGATNYEETIFWQIDKDFKVRSGKVMQYDENGHRVKKEEDHITWMHSILKMRGELPHDWELTQCLFGEHLASLDKSKPVAIVESEKTAIIASLFEPNFLWLATGGKNNLKSEMIASLQGRRIILYPDADAVSRWMTFADDASRFYDINVANIKYTEDDKIHKRDIADIIINTLQNNDKKGN